MAATIFAVSCQKNMNNDMDKNQDNQKNKTEKMPQKNSSCMEGCSSCGR